MSVSRRMAIHTRKERDLAESVARIEKSRNRVPTLWLRDGEKAIILLWKDFTLEDQSGIAEPLMLLQHYYRRKKWYSICPRIWSDVASEFEEDASHECLLCAERDEGDDQITISRRFGFSFFDNTLIHRDNRKITRASNSNKAKFIRCNKNYGKPCEACDVAKQSGLMTGAEDEWKEERMFPARAQGNSYWITSGDGFAAMEVAVEKVSQTCSSCKHGELTVIKFLCAACGSENVTQLGFEGVRCNSCSQKGQPDAEYSCSEGCEDPIPWKITRVPLEIQRRGSGPQDTIYMIQPLFNRALSDAKYNEWRKKSGIVPLDLSKVEDLKAPSLEYVQKMIGVSSQEQNWRGTSGQNEVPSDKEQSSDYDGFIEDDIPF